MPSVVAYIIGTVLAVAGTIVAFILILPEKKRGKLNGFMLWLHDFFNFNSLWLEKIMKFLYVFNTLACILIGFFMLMSVDSFYGYSHYNGLTGVILIIAGPIACRIVYEFLLMIILAVKNLMEINSKLAPQDGSVAAEKKNRRAARQPRGNNVQTVYTQPQYNQPQYTQNQYAQNQYGQQDYQMPVQPGSDYNGPSQY